MKANDKRLKKLEREMARRSSSGGNGNDGNGPDDSTRSMMAQNAARMRRLEAAAEAGDLEAAEVLSQYVDAAKHLSGLKHEAGITDPRTDQGREGFAAFIETDLGAEAFESMLKAQSRMRRKEAGLKERRG